MALDEKLKELWKNNKLAFWLLVVPLGLLLIAYQFRSVIINILLKDSRRIAIETEKKDKDLAVQQSAANAAAKQLIEDAKNLGKNKPKANEDWNKE